MRGFIRESKEKSRRNNNQKPSSNIDRLVPGVLEPATEAEERVASKIFPVLAQITSRKLFLLDIHRPWRRAS